MSAAEISGRAATLDAAEALLLEICRSGIAVRPIGDSRLGQALQESGMAVMTHVSPRLVRIEPTRRGRVAAALYRAKETP
ncbi:MAG: hypothetical protein ACK4NA_12660 [Alphaproteobacteria bacterium]